MAKNFRTQVAEYARVNEQTELVRWSVRADAWVPTTVSGRCIRATKTVIVLRIDGEEREFPRSEWSVYLD